MKFTKKQLGNIGFLIFIVLFITTPLGTYVRIGVNKLLAFSPSTIAEKNQQQLKDYNWTLRNLETGTTVNLQQYKNEVILINGWATWCPPCIAEMASLQKLYDAKKGEVNFFFVTNDEEKAVVAFMKKNNYSFPIYQPLTSIPKDLEYATIPTTYVIDSDGTIVVNESGAANWASNSFMSFITQLSQ